MKFQKLYFGLEDNFKKQLVLLQQEFKSDALLHRIAEGFNTKAFLHESAHALIGLGDEYDGPTYYGFVKSPEPNIFPSETDCQDEQTLKGRDPAACYKFTAREGGWWSIHTDTTVMEWGSMSNPWGIEAEERVKWFFSGF